MWAIPRLSPCVLLLSLFLAGCGSSSNSIMNPPPVNPQFSSTAPTTAQEGILYTYQITATTPNMSPVTFTLAQGPTGASISGSTLSWTPTHAQSRIANQFAVTASTAAGGSAQQSWSVTPTGTITITDVTTYWTPTGSQNVTHIWPASQPYPAALVPQSDGSLTRLQGTTNPDGTFGIPDVPGGYYWLQLAPTATYWTSTSNFDAGLDVVGTPIKEVPQTTTNFDFSLSGLDTTSGDLLISQTNTEGFLFGSLAVAFGQPTFNFNETVTSNIDFSQINTIFFSQYKPVTSGAFTGLALGPALTDSNVTITDGGTNNISGALTPSPQSSIPLNIKGSAWASELQNVAPVTPTPLLTDFSVSVQPFVTDRLAGSLLPAILGPNLTLLTPGTPSLSRVPIFKDYCQSSSGLILNPPPLLPLPPPILTDQDFGAISYGDPYPSSWPRMFQICQNATAQISRPNSTVTDTFQLTYGQTTAIPTASTVPIAPFVGPVQNPMLAGSNIFQPTALNSPAATLTWTAPSGAQPFGYYLTIFQLTASSTGSMNYITLARLGTAKTTMAVPFLTSGGTYIFLLDAVVDGAANMETSPRRSQLPIAHSSVISAPVTVN
jgi:hypothetical protein